MSTESQGREIKACRLECKADRERRTFEGYASTFEKPENHDSHGDIIGPKAFDETISKDFPAGFIKVLWAHLEWEPPIGKPVAMSTDSKGLHVKAKLLDTPRAHEVLEGLAEGALDALSIGFQTLASESLKEKTSWPNPERAAVPVRRINKLRLYEFGPVAWGSNPYASISSVAKGLAGHLPPVLLDELKSRLTEDLRLELKAELLEELAEKALVTAASNPDPEEGIAEKALASIRSLRNEIRSFSLH